MHLFFNPDIAKDSTTLEDEEFRHCVKVLRHVAGDIIHITDGQGKIIEARIETIEKRSLSTTKLSEQIVAKPPYDTHLFIAPTKQMERMEWMVEKCCEIGVTSITFIKTQNAERPAIKLDRLLKKSLSALKQSKSGWMTQVKEMIDLKTALKNSSDSKILIAVVKPDLDHIFQRIVASEHISIFIGPEGDFSENEIEIALNQGAKEVSLGQNVLRTETAGLYSCTAVNLINS